MAKIKEANLGQGRWLIIDTQSPSKNNLIVASLKEIDGVEIKVVSQKTYVRFNKPQARSTRYPMVSKMVHSLGKPVSRKLAKERGEQIKHYCAVILK